MLVLFVLASVLCCLYAADSIIISYCYRFYAHNPSSTKLLLLAEALKLVIAASLYLTEGPEELQKPSSDATLQPHTCYLGQQQHGSQKQQWARERALSRQRVWQTGWTLLVFSVPSLCYFAANNLSFYALTLMSGHTYTLLCDLKVPVTGALTFWALRPHHQATRESLSSLLGLFLGMCLGSYAAMRATAGLLSDIAAASSVKAAGFLLMLLVSLLSATASVFTEWVMNHSQYCHESLNLQNIRLYSIGMVLNAAYYLQSDGQLSGFFADVCAPHWAVVLVLALMGLVTGVLIKHYNNMTKLYASSIASLFASWVSQLLLQDPPPPLFYAGVALALAAAVQLPATRHSQSVDGRPGAHQQPRIKQASVVVPIALAAVVLVCLPQMVPWSSEWMAIQHGQLTPAMAAAAGASLQQLPASLHNPASLLPHASITEAPLPALPPFEPTCLVRFEKREQVGCPPMNCSLAEACHMEDTSCCAYFNHHMLGDLHRLLHAKGLQGEYAAVYGTALGAERDQAVMGHTHDVDIGFTPTALQVLAQNATREQLWRQGYVLWHDRYQWRMCPHDLHPAPEFRAAMVPNMTHTQWQKQTGAASGVYTDGYLMYPLPDGGSCAQKSADLEAAIMLQPTRPMDSLSGMAADSQPDMPGSWQQQVEGNRAAQTRRFCLQQSRLPVEIRVGGRQARVGDVNLTALENLEDHLLNTYGDGWRVPDTSYHGVTQKAADFWGVQQALLARLAVTAWGDATWPERRSRCAALNKKRAGGTRKPPPEDTAQQEQEQDQDQELEQEQREQQQQS